MAKKNVGHKYHDDEEKICGFHAAQKAFVKRGQSVAKVFIEEKRLKSFGEMLKFCAQNKIAYKVVSDQELKKVTASEHHEGICVFLKPRKKVEIDQLLHKFAKTEKALIVALHQAQNPHNIGAILRVAAHFGADAMLLESQAQNLTPSSYRIAEGGAEFVPTLFTDNLLDVLGQFKEAGFNIYSTSSHQSGNLYQTNFAKKSIILMGKEDVGLPHDLFKMGQPLSIPGTGNVESLNLSTATSILMSEFRRQVPLK